MSWLSAGAMLLTSPLLISVLFLRSVAHQVQNIKDYKRFKTFIDRYLKETEIGDRFTATFVDDIPSNTSPLIPMESLNENTRSGAIKYNFDEQLPEESFDEFIKRLVKENFGLIENPTEDQLTEIIHRKPKPIGKTVKFSDFIASTDSNDGEFSIIDAEVLDKNNLLKIIGFVLTSKRKDRLQDLTFPPHFIKLELNGSTYTSIQPRDIAQHH